MSEDNSNKPRTLGGGNVDDSISSWAQPSASSRPNIGRIGGWASGAPTCVSYPPPHLTDPPYLVCNSAGRRFGTVGDDSDEGDDEPQNYFAGGERRYSPVTSVLS
jgi:hypothetical protein